MAGATTRFQLNCVDRGLLALSSIREYPHFHWILNVVGEVDPADLGQSVLSVLRAHPNLTTTVRRCRTRTFRFHHAATFENTITVLDLRSHSPTGAHLDLEEDPAYHRALNEWVNTPIDHERHSPVRLLVVRGRGESRLVFAIDHSSLDGIRSLRFIRRVVAEYNGEPDAESSPLLGIRASGMDELAKSTRRKGSTIRMFYAKVCLSAFHRLFISPLRPAARLFHDRADRAEGIGYCFALLEPEELNSIRSGLKAFDSTVNDVLLASCFRLMEQWNRMHGKKANRLSIMVPTDLGPEWLRNAISNQLSYVSLRTGPKDRANPVKLLSKIRRDMSRMSKNGVALSIVYILRGATLLPQSFVNVWAKAITSTRVYVDTTVISNLGIVWRDARGELRMGDCRIADVRLVMPAVTPMGLCLGASTYNGRMCISLSYRTGMFSGEKAREFLDMYVDEIRSYPLPIRPEPTRETARAATA
jgi:NRPS condensation-like uncharacterized protein